MNGTPRTIRKLQHVTRDFIELNIRGVGEGSGNAVSGIREHDSLNNDCYHSDDEN